MSVFFEKDKDIRTYSPLSLAFMGDAVYELLVRDYMVSKGNSTVKKLNSAKVEFVRCEYQAAAGTKLMDVFTEEEKEVYMRGRNAHVGHVPKNSSVADYHAATALEAVFGYLYLKGENERLQELFRTIIE